jgi:hypothetical protein
LDTGQSEEPHRAARLRFGRCVSGRFVFGQPFLLAANASRARRKCRERANTIWPGDDAGVLNPSLRADRALRRLDRLGVAAHYRFR